jgi:hypothetical protein
MNSAWAKLGLRPMAENIMRGPCQPALWCTPRVWSPRVLPTQWHGRLHPASGQKVARFSGKAPSATCGGSRQGEAVGVSPDKHGVKTVDSWLGAAVVVNGGLSTAVVSDW